MASSASKSMTCSYESIVDSMTGDGQISGFHDEALDYKS